MTPKEARFIGRVLAECENLYDAVSNRHRNEVALSAGVIAGMWAVGRKEGLHAAAVLSGLRDEQEIYFLFSNREAPETCEICGVDRAPCGESDPDQCTFDTSCE